LLDFPAGRLRDRHLGIQSVGKPSEIGFLALSIRIPGGRPGKGRPKAQRAQTQNHHRLLGNSNPTCGPFPSASGLSLAGFLFPLLKSVLGVGSNPAIRQQGFRVALVPAE